MASGFLTSKQIVYISLVGDMLIFITKLVAAALTGSSSMMSEAVHTLVDTANDALLLYGYRRAERRPDLIHPLGYGRELYFWSFIVALMLFGFGALVAIFEGSQQLTRPESIEHPILNYAVLACSFIFESISWLPALQRLRMTRGKGGYWDAIHRSKDPASFMVLFEDSAALIGIVIAALGTYLSKTWGMPILDGIASISIGIVLAVVAALLACENMSLLIGERASPALVTAVVVLAKAEPGVIDVHGALTIHLAPDQIMIALSIEFAEQLRALEIENCVAAIEHRIKDTYPDIAILFVKPQTSNSFEAWRAHRFGTALQITSGASRSQW
jgi:cation diffusion facilitator family transporter